MMKSEIKEKFWEKWLPSSSINSTMAAARAPPTNIKGLLTIGFP